MKEVIKVWYIDGYGKPKIDNFSKMIENCIMVDDVSITYHDDYLQISICLRDSNWEMVGCKLFSYNYKNVIKVESTR